MDGSTSVTESLLNDLAEGDTNDRVCLGELLDRFERRAFGVFLLGATLPSLIPVPFGIAIVSGAVVALVGAQIALPMKRPWLPQWLRRRGIRRVRVQRLVERMRRPLRWLGRMTRPRLESLSDSTLANIGTGVQVALLGMLQSLPIPFTNIPIGCLLLLYCFAMIERDGALMLVAWAIGSTAIATIVYLTWHNLP